MKTIKTIFALSLFALTLNSCDAVEDLIPDFNVDIKNLEGSAVVVIEPGTTSANEDYTFEITDPDVLDNLNKIKVVAVKGFTYTISNVTAEEGTTLSGTITSGNQSVSISNVLIANGETGEITDPAFFNALQNDFKQDAKATITVEGSVNNDAGATFTLTIKPTLTVTIGG